MSTPWYVSKELTFIEDSGVCELYIDTAEISMNLTKEFYKEDIVEMIKHLQLLVDNDVLFENKIEKLNTRKPRNYR